MTTRKGKQKAPVSDPKSPGARKEKQKHDQNKKCARSKAPTSEKRIEVEETADRITQRIDLSVDHWKTINANGVETTEDAALPTGLRIGSYLIEEEIGQGGFSRVYRVTHTQLKTEFALKVFKHWENDPEVSKISIQSEIRALHGLKHPCLPMVYDLGQLKDGRKCLVTELAPGTDLRKIIKKRNGRFSPEEAIQLVRNVANILQFVHLERRILHLDLNPANIIWDQENNRLSVVDFGLARVQWNASKTPTNTTVSGTPPYMAPEQWQSSPHDWVTPQTDVWALGVLLYELLVGKRPFEIDSDLPEARQRDDLRQQILKAEPSFPTSSIHSSLAEVLKKALRKDPNQRHETAHAFDSAVRRAWEVGTNQARELRLLSKNYVQNPESVMVALGYFRDCATLLRSEYREGVEKVIHEIDRQLEEFKYNPRTWLEAQLELQILYGIILTAIGAAKKDLILRDLEQLVIGEKVIKYYSRKRAHVSALGKLALQSCTRESLHDLITSIGDVVMADGIFDEKEREYLERILRTARYEDSEIQEHLNIFSEPTELAARRSKVFEQLKHFVADTLAVIAEWQKHDGKEDPSGHV